MCNLPSVRHTRARLARIRNRTVYTRGRETDCQPVLQECSRRVSASRARKSYAGERTRDARETVLADQRASEHSLRCECASLGEGTRGIGCERDAPLSGAAKSGVHVPVYQASEGVDRVDSEGRIRFESETICLQAAPSARCCASSRRCGAVKSPRAGGTRESPRARLCDSTPRGDQWNRSRRMPCVCPPFWG